MTRSLFSFTFFAAFLIIYYSSEVVIMWFRYFIGIAWISISFSAIISRLLALSRSIFKLNKEEDEVLIVVINLVISSLGFFVMLSWAPLELSYW